MKYCYCFLFFYFFSCKSTFLTPLENNKNNFDVDNIIFTKEKTFEFDVIIKDGKVFKNNNNVSKIQMKIIGGLMPFIKYDSTYNQTVIQYNYFNKNGDVISTEKTGLIENETNIWIHPPRWDDFLIINTNSYPFFILSNKVNKWYWILNNKYENTELINIIRYKKINHKNGIRIMSKTKNINGIGKAEYIFDSNNKLITMKFNNFDKSEIVLKLINEKEGTK
jgi:hypothetical protein